MTARLSFGRNEAFGDLTIGITTYKDRYSGFLKPLLKRLLILLPECRIIITANGHVNSDEQAVYLKKIIAHCSKLPNVHLIYYDDPQGLSFLWNTIISNSVAGKILLLNDDLKIKTGFRRFLSESGILSDNVATINSSWSNFLISRSIIESIGPFDEGLRELGGEDDDYLARLAMHGMKPENYFTDTIAGKRKRKRHISGVNSYGRDMSKESGGYSSINTGYLFNKWEISDEYFPGAVEVKGRKHRYWKLRPESQSYIK